MVAVTPVPETINALEIVENPVTLSVVAVTPDPATVKPPLTPTWFPKVDTPTCVDTDHFFTSLVQNMTSCIHINVKYGDNDHHKIEAAIKSLAVALREASNIDKKQKGIPSTKGSM